jgi:hypothetical protein
MSEGAPATPPTPPATFSAEYVAELRHENGNWRKKAQEHEAAATAATAAAATAKADAEKAAGEKITAAEQVANDRIVRAELKTLAIEAGMIDLDGLKLADLTKVKLNDKGEVEGAAELIKDLKAKKAYLFKEPSTSSGDPAPKPGDKKPVDAMKMTPDELKAYKASIGVRA